MIPCSGVESLGGIATDALPLGLLRPEFDRLVGCVGFFFFFPKNFIVELQSHVDMKYNTTIVYIISVANDVIDTTFQTSPYA